VEIQPDIDYLTWDDWNTNHIAKHGLSVEDVEQVVFGRPVARDLQEPPAIDRSVS